MPNMDVFLIHGIVEELKKEIPGGFINKIYQLNRYDLTLRIRRQGQERNLLISTHPDYARLHLTEKKICHPPRLRPVFSAYLRKHLQGGAGGRNYPRALRKGSADLLRTIAGC